MNNRQSALIGLLIGDAIGVPFEFKTVEELKKYNDNCFVLPTTNFSDRSHRGAPTSAWSDDGAMALALLDSLISCNGLNTTDLTQRFLAWYDRGQYAVQNIVFDVGTQTQDALVRFRNGFPIEMCSDETSPRNGNGSLMRVLPLSLWHRGSRTELIEWSMLQSVPTHAHSLSKVSCAVYSVWSSNMLSNNGKALFKEAVDEVEEYLRNEQMFSDLASISAIKKYEDKPITGTGYVVDTLWAVKYAIEKSSSFKDAIVQSIRYGGDTDTIASLTGGLAGLKFGASSIPSEWIDALPKHDILEKGLLNLK